MKYKFQDHEITLERKKIKHIYLSITPEGEIRIRIPQAMTNRETDYFLETKRDWIEQKLAERKPLKSIEWIDGEPIPLLGKTYRLKLTDSLLSLPMLDEGEIFMQQLDPDVMNVQLDKFYRTHLQTYLDRRIVILSQEMELSPSEWRIRKMKTRWGSCNPRAGRLWFNLELAKKDPELVDYVIVHELCHLIEPGHNQRFYRVLGQYLPDWSERKKRLNGRLDV